MNRRTQTIALPGIAGLFWFGVGLILRIWLPWAWVGSVAGIMLTALVLAWFMQCPQERQNQQMADNRRDYFLHPLLTYYRRSSSPLSAPTNGTAGPRNGSSSVSRGDGRTR